MHGIGECVFCPSQATTSVEIENIETGEQTTLPMCDECSRHFLIDAENKELN